VTGAAGSIGSVLADAIAQGGPRQLIQLDLAEDICSTPVVDRVFATYSPDLVYHAAALKDVPQLERDPFAAVRTNVLGTNNLVQAAVRHGASMFVMISTDKAVNPHSIMGATKRLAEILLMQQSSGGTCMRAVRLGNVLASRGSVVPLFERQIAERKPVTVTHPDVSRYFLTLEEAARLILMAASLRGDGGIFVPNLGSPYKIVDLAHYMIGTRDNPIVFTGLRPGDKLHEEMVSTRESIDPKPEGELYRVRGNAPPIEDVMTELESSVQRSDLSALLRTIHRIVPEYEPSELLVGAVYDRPFLKGFAEPLKNGRS
jgi:FlaA1/EpsC-like NDP-sugar epimerase